MFNYPQYLPLGPNSENRNLNTMRLETGIRVVLLLVPAFLAGALTFYAMTLFQHNVRLVGELDDQDALRSQLQAQQQLNTRQREDFEGRIQQLQNNLQSAQTQMTNLSAALQEARELIMPSGQSSPPTQNQQ